MLYRTWIRTELPARAPPLTLLIVLALVGLWDSQGLDDVAGKPGTRRQGHREGAAHDDWRAAVPRPQAMASRFRPRAAAAGAADAWPLGWLSDGGAGVMLMICTSGSYRTCRSGESCRCSLKNVRSSLLMASSLALSAL